MVAPLTFCTPRHPACTIALRVQRCTARSFVTHSPPDYLAVWLLDVGFRPIAKSYEPTEYGRFRLGEELVVLSWDGSAFVYGADWRATAARLAEICEDAPESVCLFDLLDESGVLS